MKKYIFACLLMITHMSYTHKADNPYYDFVKKHTLSFAQSLSPKEKNECLKMLTGHFEPNKSWLDRLNQTFESLYAHFLEGYYSCVSCKDILITDDSNHIDEFWVYAGAAFYRVVYEHAPEDAAYANALWMTPDEIDAECLQHIHN